MNTHILFLNVLILIATAFSNIFIQSIIMAITGKELNSTVKISKYIILYYLIIVISLGLIDEVNILSSLPLKLNWIILISIPLSFIILFLELVPSILKAKLMNYRLDIKLSDKWCGEKGTIFILVVIIAMLEEIIFRGVWYEVLVNLMNLKFYIFILLSSVFFGINHMWFGRGVFLQKIISGACFSIIYVISGNLLLVLLTHIIENIIILGRYNKS